MEPAVLGEYYTVAGTGTAEIVDRRSRFLGAVAPAADEQEAQAFLAEIRREHWEARHHVYAYVVEGGRIRRCSDDGEPQGTGGKPVLDVVQGAELMQCVAVVTRYFGGILLGTGGLVRAYSHAAARAVEAAGRVCMKPWRADGNRLRLRAVRPGCCPISPHREARWRTRCLPKGCRCASGCRRMSRPGLKRGWRT